MATDRQIDQIIKSIREIVAKPEKYEQVYGNSLSSIEVNNVRGLSVEVPLTWPVMAIGGVNGSGKTTILQVASAAYSKDPEREGGGRYYKLGDWIRGGLRGETPPLRAGSGVAYQFNDDTPRLQINYSPDNTRWAYPRRNNPIRDVRFMGIAEHVPSIERRDTMRVFKNRLTVSAQVAFKAEFVRGLNGILGGPYTGGNFNTVGARGGSGSWSRIVADLRRGGATYSEPHMGAGEQKMIHIVSTMEFLPRNSLVLLEEPELTLHADAQRGLAWYLMDVSKRKGLQVIIATHSRELFETLPTEARVLLYRKSKNIEVLPHPPFLRIARELSAKSSQAFIFVEDEVAARFLREILTETDRELMNQAKILPLGDAEQVRKLTASFRSSGVHAVAVRDGDQGANVGEGLFSLPGAGCPEHALLEDRVVAHADQFLHGIGDALERARLRIQAKSQSAVAKETVRLLADEMGLEDEKIVDRLTLAWMHFYREDAMHLAEEIREAIDGTLSGAFIATLQAH